MQLKAKEKGNFTPVSVAMDHWGYGPKSSGGIRTVATLSQFGLVEIKGKGNDRTVRPSQLASTILDSPDSEERRESTKIAALNPDLFNEIWEQYDGNLPSEDSLIWELTGRGDPSAGRLTEQAVGSFLKVFLETLEYAGFIGHTHGLEETGPDTEVDQPVEHTSVLSTRRSKVQSTDISYIELPLPVGSGIEGIIRLPKSLTSSQWEKALEALETIKNLRPLIVDDTKHTDDASS
ncbi:MAG: hypothetical protein OXI19_00260 [Gemmatimonadota bacterium]|nr:hypothetical protein [Gemmatimonadota bacterium]